MAPDSLVDMARRTCGRNIRNLYSIGGLRVELIKPLFMKIENPDQLHALEINSPSVIGHTREAWISLLKRKIPNLESRLPDDWQTTLFAEENAERWHMIYKKLKKQVDKETAATEKKLAIQLAESNSKTVAPVIDRPRTVLQVGKNRYANAAAAYTTNFYKAGKPGGPGFFERVRASDQRRKAARMATPTHLLKPRMMNGVTKAPAGLVEELRQKKAIEAEQQQLEQKQREQKHRAERGEIVARPPKAMGAASFKDRDTRAPKAAKPPLHGGNYDLIKDREDRLRALKAGKAATPPKPSLYEIAKLTADFLEDDEEEDADQHHSDERHRSTLDDDDLFDEKPRRKVVAAKVSPPRSRDSPKPAGRATSPVGGDRKLASVQPSNMGPIIRKRKDPPTLFRPNKR